MFGVDALIENSDSYTFAVVVGPDRERIDAVAGVEVPLQAQQRVRGQGVGVVVVNDEAIDIGAVEQRVARVGQDHMDRFGGLE